jgi:2-polyprenyl-6-methoxyphenol hydroxylase-like FAD-dependent oxidoreductase
LASEFRGRFGEYPPTDEDGFLAFAKSLYTQRVYEIIKDAERISDIVQHRFPTSVLRHYERLAAFPERLLVLGDTISSFNPSYGQGMSSAALQVKALQELLTEGAEDPRGLEGLAPLFFAKAAEVIATPWALAAVADFAFPRTTGERPGDIEESARYFAALDALQAEDIEVHRLVSDVFNLVKPLSVLSEEPLRSRVLAREARLQNA